MIVKELIELLQKCNPNDIVMFDIENSLKNGAFTDDEETHFPVDDVLTGYGTLKGFVFLQEDLEE